MDEKQPSPVGLDGGRRIRLFSVPWKRGWDLFLTEATRDGAMYLAAPPQMSTVSDGELLVNPTMQVSDATVQELMDELWRQGVRPRNGAGSAGQLLALENHLDDIRALCVKFTGAKLPDRKG